MHQRALQVLYGRSKALWLGASIGALAVYDYQSVTSHAKEGEGILEEHKVAHTPQCGTVSVYATRGPRPFMEDEFYVSDDKCFFGVYDGHGGPLVGTWVCSHVCVCGLVCM